MIEEECMFPNLKLSRYPESCVGGGDVSNDPGWDGFKVATDTVNLPQASYRFG